MKTLRAIVVACALATAVILSGCASLGLGSSGEPSVSPRAAVLAAADNVEPVLDEVTVLLATGAISDNVADDIAQFGPEVQKIAAAYFDRAASCTVVAGALVSDPAGGRECEPSTLKSLYDAFDREIIAWMVSASERGDQKTAGIIAGARLVVSLVPKPLTAGQTVGYRDEPDVPLALFEARHAALKQAFAGMLAAAQARAGK